VVVIQILFQPAVCLLLPLSGAPEEQSSGKKQKKKKKKLLFTTGSFMKYS